MKRLNYNHLFYFWSVARTGSVSKSAKELKLSQPTVSEQIHALEDHLGCRLLRRAGRGLVMTQTGKVVFGYADKIFRLGGQLTDAVKKRKSTPKKKSPRRKTKP